MADRRPVLEVVREGAQWIVKVDGSPRRWFHLEAEADAFVDGFDNCYDSLSDVHERELDEERLRRPLFG